MNAPLGSRCRWCRRPLAAARRASTCSGACRSQLSRARVSLTRWLVAGVVPSRTPPLHLLRSWACALEVELSAVPGPCKLGTPGLQGHAHPFQVEQHVSASLDAALRLAQLETVNDERRRAWVAIGWAFRELRRGWPRRTWAPVEEAVARALA